MKTNVRIIIAVFALCLSVFVPGAVAQTSTTGSIEGSVVDVNGAVVPGVTVSVTSPNLISPQSATTNQEGVYRIPSLPPGRYTVVVEAAGGFGRYEQTNIEVNLSRTTTIEVRLQPQGSSETVTVTATSGATIDTTNNTTGSNISTELFSNIPNQRTITSLYSIAPTVTRSGLRDASGRDRDPSVGGSSGPENNYILDGVNTTDPAFGGSGANLPFEFVQEVEVKTGAFGAEYGLSTGGIFNVITKAGGNEFRGDIFGYLTTRALVRETRNFPSTGSAPNGFSEFDAGFDLGGPIIRDRLWFFGAFNPQRRENSFLTQTFRQEVENRITTPFYAGKITYAINNNNTLTFSTFADFTRQEGFLFGNSGFGADPNSFRGEIETGGSNYTVRLNSTFSPNFIAEFAFGAHFQRANTIPEESVANVPQVLDNFAILRGGSVLPVVDTNITSAQGFVAFVDGRGGSLERNFVRQGFGLITDQNRDRFEAQARFQNTVGRNTIKYGFEFNRNLYQIDTRPSGPAVTFADPNGLTEGDGSNIFPRGYRVTNNFGACTVQGNTVVCPAAALTQRVTALIAGGGAPAGITSAITNTSLTAAQLSTNPFLVRSSTRVRDFLLFTGDNSTRTDVESFYIQDEFRVFPNLTLSGGMRWDYQQSYGANGTQYIAFNNFIENLQPRFGVTYDFTNTGRGKLFANFARYLETPIPLDVNVRAAGDAAQIDNNNNVNRLNAPASAIVSSHIGCLGCEATPIDPDLRPQDVYEVTAGFEYELVRNLAVGVRGIYRAQGSVIEDGSFDDGTTYFLFNPGESLTDRIAQQPPAFDEEGNQIFGEGIGGVGQGFGRARRYYRAVEFSATKRFSNDYQFITSYVFSSLIGNYEGLFRNDNGQSDPNITSLFDLVSLLNNLYGRLPNDRPHQFKFDGSYTTPFRGLVVGASFRAQSGIPFNQFVPHPVYGNNEGLAVPRGTAINPVTGDNRTPFTTNLDLNVYFPITLGENRQLRFQADFFNVFNSQRAVTQDQTFSINSGIPGAQGIQFANPFYGNGQIFQFPTAVRLGVKFQF